MDELLRSNNTVVLSFVEALLKEARIHHVTFDTHMSVMEGSLGILPRRILVPSGDLQAARTILTDAGLQNELSPVSEA